MSLITIPIIRDRRDLRLRAIGFGRYPRRRMASSTRARVASLTRALPAMTWLTVPTLTPASSATSLIVGIPQPHGPAPRFCERIS